MIGEEVEGIENVLFPFLTGKQRGEKESCDIRIVWFVLTFHSAFGSYLTRVSLIPHWVFVLLDSELLGLVFLGKAIIALVDGHFFLVISLQHSNLHLFHSLSRDFFFL